MKFRLDQLSYISDKLVEAGTEIELAPIGRNKATGEPIYHVPGPHWKAVDPEAIALCERLGTKFTGEVPDMVDNIELRDASAIDYEKLGNAIGAGVVAAMEAWEARRNARPADVVPPPPPPAPDGDGGGKPGKDGKGAKA